MDDAGMARTDLSSVVDGDPDAVGSGADRGAPRDRSAAVACGQLVGGDAIGADAQETRRVGTGALHEHFDAAAVALEVEAHSRARIGELEARRAAAVDH